MARSGFAIRLGYMLWLRHLQTGTMPGFAEIGRAVGRVAGGEALTGQAVSGWLKRDEAPDTYRNNRALASVLGVSEDWLIEGQGNPPRPDLWAAWTTARGEPLPIGAIDKKDMIPVPKPSKASKTATKGTR